MSAGAARPPRYVDHHGHPGRWQLEGHCGDCGTIAGAGPPRLATVPIEQVKGRLPTFCKGYYNGRPGGRCGFVLSWVWIFYPASKV